MLTKSSPIKWALLQRVLLLFYIFSFITITPLLAQDNKEDETIKSNIPLSIMGSVDTYFRSNLTAAQTDANGAAIASRTSFANGTGFSLGMVNLIVAKETDKVGFLADLVFGSRGDEAVFGSVGNPAIVNQLNVYWSINDNVTLTLGNFNTFLGYEVISPVVNFNYTTSYMFSYGPFSHTGLKADFKLNNELSAMLAILNPTDMTEMNW
jgi:hypothetical protein